MAKYCFDTSGLSTPYEQMPEDIHESMWNDIKQFIADGHAAVTREIFDEMIMIDGGLGDFVRASQDLILYEVGSDDWSWETYLVHVTRMQDDYKSYISEFIGGSKKTVCLNDLSIIALAKTLDVPVLSMEAKVTDESALKRRIPNICDYEDVMHVTISDFLRLENYKY